MEAMLARSPLASHSFTSTTGNNIRVFFQDRQGNIRISSYDEQSGWSSGSKGSAGKALLNNGIAVIGWDNGNQVLELSTVYRSIRCHCDWREGWFDGELTGMFTTAHYSNIAALSFDDRGTKYLRVYYQDKDNVVCEVCKDGTKDWSYGHRFPPAIQGTSIACSQVPGRGFCLRLFYQKSDTTFIEYLMQGGSNWKVGSFKSERVYGPGAYITCASYGKDDHRVFTIDRDNRLCLTEFNTGDNSWSKTRTLLDTIPSSPAAAVLVAGKPPFVRIYLQTRGGQITEWANPWFILLCNRGPEIPALGMEFANTVSPHYSTIDAVPTGNSPSNRQILVGGYCTRLSAKFVDTQPSQPIFARKTILHECLPYYHAMVPEVNGLLLQDISQAEASRRTGVPCPMVNLWFKMQCSQHNHTHSGRPPTLTQQDIRHLIYLLQRN
ncbi:hypothetical protein C7212DRAFT_363917 [Tuber magnatum]|uniref:Uncharacterized protein n=1 Tax=Tuber magnatum TaxID=42249 RepID=A0A317SNI8_9PEZI|nr:hypothetical protein C7212DRAFT_363917 [Tuber magnatum]